NKTEIVTIEASLLDLEETPTEYLASVEFSGLVREETWGGASPIREMWNLVKPRNGSSGWQLAGIQQLN
ncbi:MAG: Tim44 domain-containing protein, partial [Thiomonas sp.]